jgi:hypothetical protein
MSPIFLMSNLKNFRRRNKNETELIFIFFESFSIWPMEEPTQLCQSAIEKKTREKNAR